MGVMSIVGNAPPSSVESDRRIWWDWIVVVVWFWGRADKSGFFSCKSFFDLLIDSPDDNTFVPYKMIWKIGTPSKVKIFSWLAAWNRVNTCDLLQSKRPNLAISPSWCILCKRDSESIDHIFLHCNFAQYIWAEVKREFNVIGVMSRSWHDFLCIDWGVRAKKNNSKVLWRCCCMAVACHIWLERNARIFEDRNSEVANIWSKAKFTASLGAFSSK